jgi:hypothetical protein
MLGCESCEKMATSLYNSPTLPIVKIFTMNLVPNQFASFTFSNVPSPRSFPILIMEDVGFKWL